MGTNEELDESEFVQETGPRYLWLFLILLMLFLGLMWGIGTWKKSLERERLHDSPFYQVTNRAFSLFLWQNPEYMRTNAKLSEAYLPHFHTSSEVNVIPELADEYVAAPPDILYRYHTWKRLIGNFVADRPIYRDSFEMFLNSNQEWLPDLWKEAPEGYERVVRELSKLEDPNLQNLPEAVFPLEVRMAYMGWYNYTREWEAIHQFIPTENRLKTFLKAHPQYARSYWRNFVPGYLKKPLSNRDLTWFLKSAGYNFFQSEGTTTKPSS